MDSGRTKLNPDTNGSVSDRWPSAMIQKLLAVVGEDGGWQRPRLVVRSSMRSEVGNYNWWRRGCGNVEARLRYC